MRVIRSIKEFKHYRYSLSNANIGFVKTMGALSYAHKELIKKSVKDNDITVVSIIVNPTKFTSKEELDKHPKAEILDIDTCKNLQVDVVFIPDIKDLMQSEIFLTAPARISKTLEAISRPQHFDMVLIILNRLINLIKPKKVYLGKKDAQQLILANIMVRDFFMNVEIYAYEIIRENDGLAMSSVNSALNPTQRLYALRIYRSLLKAKTLVQDEKNYNIKDIRTAMEEILEPLDIEYIAFRSKNFEELNQIELNNTIILVAASISKIRLTDNIWL